MVFFLIKKNRDFIYIIYIIIYWVNKIFYFYLKKQLIPFFWIKKFHIIGKMGNKRIFIYYKNILYKKLKQTLIEKN